MATTPRRNICSSICTRPRLLSVMRRMIAACTTSESPAVVAAAVHIYAPRRDGRRIVLRSQPRRSRNDRGSIRCAGDRCGPMSRTWERYYAAFVQRAVSQRASRLRYRCTRSTRHQPESSCCCTYRIWLGIGLRIVNRRFRYPCGRHHGGGTVRSTRIASLCGWPVPSSQVLSLNPTRLDDQDVAVPLADRITQPARLQIPRMRAAIEEYLAKYEFVTRTGSTIKSARLHDLERMRVGVEPAVRQRAGSGSSGCRCSLLALPLLEQSLPPIRFKRSRDL